MHTSAQHIIYANMHGSSIGMIVVLYNIIQNFTIYFYLFSFMFTLPTNIARIYPYMPLLRVPYMA